MSPTIDATIVLVGKARTLGRIEIKQQFLHHSLLGPNNDNICEQACMNKPVQVLFGFTHDAFGIIQIIEPEIE